MDALRTKFGARPPGEADGVAALLERLESIPDARTLTSRLAGAAD